MKLLAVFYLSVLVSISHAMSDWDVSIGPISSQSFEFGTGQGAGENPNMKIKVKDFCRTESKTRNTIGELFPTSTIPGIRVNAEGVVSNPGDGNSIAFSFEENISENRDIFKDNGDKTATVQFCVEVGLYDGDSLVNFKEAKLTHNIDLITNFVTLIGDE
ncbi:expressed unknown protein [Seminavis robusta]|uniref:Uncharacterized protein n=1 Tax=Seminavis robusta TaxID=568900 RepID=A0A9N8EE78_9STRA|nr:expressed unknown protein [Seminavis robusta]|eukprot:Sro947_g223370.1 n/a (160) ;mRNA; f:6029-6622